MDEIEKVMVQEHDILQFVISKDYWMTIKSLSIDDMNVLIDQIA